MADVTVDAKGLKCPMPIARTAAAIKSVEEGQLVEVCADDPVFETDIQSFCRVSGNVLESLTVDDGIVTAVIKKEKRA